MLTLKQIYDDKAKVIAGLNKKHFSGAQEAIDEVLRLDGERKAAQQEKDAAEARVRRTCRAAASAALCCARSAGMAASASAYHVSKSDGSSSGS